MCIFAVYGYIRSTYHTLLPVLKPADSPTTKEECGLVTVQALLYVLDIPIPPWVKK